MMRLWQRFWFEPTSPAPLCLFRIGLGFLILQLLLVPIGTHLDDWLGATPLAPFDLIYKINWRGQPRYDVFQLLAGNSLFTVAYFYSLVISAIGVCLGCFSQFNLLYTALGLTSFANHVPVVFPEGYDKLLRLSALALSFSPAGEMYSLDSLFANRKGNGESGPVLCSPWALRMVQLQLCFVYIESGFTKMLVPGWWDGTYLYYTTHLTEMARLPAFGIFDQLWILKVSSWYTMAVEFLAPLLIWIKPLRYYALCSLIFLHVFIDLFVYLPFFEATFIWTLIVFVYPSDIEKLMALVKGFFLRLRPIHA